MNKPGNKKYSGNKHHPKGIQWKTLKHFRSISFIYSLFSLKKFNREIKVFQLDSPAFEPDQPVKHWAKIIHHFDDDDEGRMNGNEHLIGLICIFVSSHCCCPMLNDINGGDGGSGGAGDDISSSIQRFFCLFSSFLFGNRLPIL